MNEITMEESSMVELPNSPSNTEIMQPGTSQNSTAQLCANGRKKTLLERISTWWQNIIHPSKYFLMELERTFYALLFFAFCVIIMVIFQLISDWLFERSLSQNKEIASLPLDDRILHWIPDLTKISRLPDYLVQAFLVLTVIFNVLLRDRKGNLLKFGGLVMLRRMLFIMGFIYFLRAFCFFVTALPNPRPQCQLQYPTGYWTNYIVLVVKILTGQIASCTDNIFSGHTSMAIICLLTFHLYQSRIWVIIGAYVIAFCTIFAILATHLHYTVDVLIAIIVSSSIYLSYHYLVILSLDDIFFTRKLGHAPHTLAGFSWQERNVMMKQLKMVLIKLIRWIDGIDIRLYFSPSYLVQTNNPIEESIGSNTVSTEFLNSQCKPSSSNSKYQNV